MSFEEGRLVVEEEEDGEMLSEVSTVFVRVLDSAAFFA